MKSIKNLMLAMAGLAGFALAGSAFAQCSNTNLNAWSSQSVIQGAITVVGPGMNSTACEMQVAFTAAGASLIAKAFVIDTSPVDEPRYRARFYVDTTNITGGTNVLYQSRIFSAAGTSTLAGVQNDMVEVVLVGTSAGNGPTVRFLVADANVAGDYAIINATLPNPKGQNYIEFDLQKGAPGSFRYWVTAAGTASSDGSPTGTLAIGDNTKWTGVTQANLGLLTASGQYRANATATQNLFLDEFDSRRQTFIGQ
jgi:hypothetical protein